MSITNEDIAQGLSYVFNEGTFKDLPRHYLGMSQLGHVCSRYLWLYFRWADKIEHTHRKMRIFQAGHDSEEIIVNDLRRVGVIVENQQTELSHCDGYILGHTDGTVYNLPDMEDHHIVLEAKSAKNSSWKGWQKNGVKRHNKEYYCQSQVYMNKFGLDLALFIVLNKDTSELLFEFVAYDKIAAEALLDRGEDIVYSPVPPKGINTDPTYYVCGWCEFKEVCHEHKAFSVTCRTCEHIVLNNGNWYCDLRHEDRNLEQQKEACQEYEMLKV